MSDRKQRGEGNPEADRRYRKGVRETVEETSEADRAEKARKLSKEEREEARRAEDEGRSRARH